VLIVQVLRGGAWNNQLDNVACAIRNGNEPDDRNNNIGFRCAKTPCGKTKSKKQTAKGNFRQARFPGIRRLMGCRSVETWVFIALVRRPVPQTGPKIKERGCDW